MRVFLVPKYIEKSNIPFKVDATVEAEYGSEIIEGDLITLAHHIEKYRHFHAPCVQEVEKIDDDSNIVISHIDLDTLGGIAALMGIKKENKEFWEACEFIDLNGPHHLNEVKEDIRNKIIAYNSYAAINHMNKLNEITDVTDIILDRINIIDRILDNDIDLINDGLSFYNKEQDQIENCLLVENDNIRVFYSKNGLFCNANYYSPKKEKIIPYIVTYNGFYDSLSFSSENGGSDISCREVMQSLFGKEAGGHTGIAGSPRNHKMNFDDYKKLIGVVNEMVNEKNHTDYKLEMEKCLNLEIKK